MSEQELKERVAELEAEVARLKPSEQAQMLLVPLAPCRERLGREVRAEWIAWARMQPSPKASWLVPWEGLNEPDREVDRRIGERLFALGARFKPSEQVAEDRDILWAALSRGEEGTPYNWERLSRLAAKAQGYEASERECARLAAENAKFTSLIMATGSERDAAVAENDRLARAHRAEMQDTMRQVGEATEEAEAMMADRNDARAEIEALKADNAALVEFVVDQARVDCDAAGQCGGECGPCLAKALRDQPHPGAALLEEVATLRGVRAQAQVDAKFIHDALGWAGEWPRSLPAPSRAVVALLKEVTRLRESKALLQKVAAICRGLQQPDEEALSVLEPLLEELETLRGQRALFDEVATALYGYTEFSGPCAHGSAPWDRCDECGEKSAVYAAAKAVDAWRARYDERNAEAGRLRACLIEIDTVAKVPGAPVSTETGRNVVAAMVRARNEGLERAVMAVQNFPPAQFSRRALINDIRALKEPES